MIICVIYIYTYDAVSSATSVDVEIDPEFLACCKAMQQDFQGDYIGPDFVPQG